MTNDQLIVKQQIEIEELRIDKKAHDIAVEEVLSIMHCIGGPLNDNKKGYTIDQLKEFFKIKDALGLGL